MTKSQVGGGQGGVTKSQGGQWSDQVSGGGVGGVE